MTFLHDQRRQTSRIWRRVSLPVALVAALLALIVTGGALGYRINLTPSEPLGIWRIQMPEGPYKIGDLVFVCPPPTPTMREAFDRGYLRSGLCPGGYAPLIKTIVAVSSQRIEIDRLVSIDGLALPHSAPAQLDGRGRSLRRFSGGTVPTGYVFLHSGFIGSFDSRYFGPVPASGVLGLAKAVLTYAP